MAAPALPRRRAGNYSVSSDKYGLSKSGVLPAADNGGNYVLPVGSETGALLTKIDADTETIEWEIAGENIRTKHPVYVIGGQLTEENNFHTLIDLGCKAARGLNTNAAAKYTAIWNKYATLEINRIDGAGPITYWGTNAGITYHAGDVLSALTGRCGTWSDMFIKTCQLQGVTVGKIHFETVSRLNYLYQDAENFQGGSPSPERIFGDHVVNTFGNTIYDVTCGVTADDIRSYIIDNVKVDKVIGVTYNDGIPSYVYERIDITEANLDTYINIFYLNGE